MSVRVCVLGSGSKGNSTWIATETTRLLVDTGFSKRETTARLAAVGECVETCNALLISHEHSDHVNGLRKLALDLKAPVYITRATRDAIEWGPEIKAVEWITAGNKFRVGDIEVTPFTIPHDAVDPVAFTFEAQGIKIGIVTDLGYIPELVRQHVRACHCLVFESNHDLDMLKVGPYPWHIKQRVLGRQGHLSNLATADFLGQEFDGAAQVLVLAHLSETNNHPEIARITAEQALAGRASDAATELHLASQTAPSKVFRW
ncbi:MAG TPA: MBL fold metallo-hydrolase [Terriglobia bacterium]|nr:MBL fold metallo-hydrolase [Terriglobia bacterium]